MPGFRMGGEPSPSTPYVKLFARHYTSDVSHKWLALCRKGFWPPARRERRAYPSWVCKEQATTRETKRTAARRVAPKMAWGFVVPQSSIPADMLLRHAARLSSPKSSPQAILG